MTQRLPRAELWGRQPQSLPCTQHTVPAIGIMSLLLLPLLAPSAVFLEQVDNPSLTLEIGDLAAQAIVHSHTLVGLGTYFLAILSHPTTPLPVPRGVWSLH